MKIKTRSQLLEEYNNKYSVRNADNDVYERLEKYFKDNNLNFTKHLTKAIGKMKSLKDEVSYKTVKIIMYEYPMKTDRPRHTRFGKTYSPNAAENKKYVMKALKRICTNIKLIHTPGEIIIDAYMEMPSQIKPDEVILYEMKKLKVHSTPDYDNIGKCYTDMLKDNIILDDDLFYSGTINKYYSIIPRVEITIKYLSSYDSEHTFRKMKNRKSVKEAIELGLIEFE